MFKRHYGNKTAITTDYFLLDGQMATDNYFNDSFLVRYFLKDKKGLWQRPEGGYQIRIPIEYDEQTSGFFSRGSTIDTSDRPSINAAVFDWKHAYSNRPVSNNFMVH